MADLPEGHKYFKAVNCEECQLYKSCQSALMDGHGPKKPKILVIAEAPAREDDQQGKVFTGRAGKMLKSALEMGGEFDLKEVRFTSAIRCMPQGKVSDHPKAVAHCRGALEKEIAETKPDFIIALGNASLRSLTNQVGIMSHRGKMVNHDGKSFFATIDPKQALADPAIQQTFFDDMVKAGKFFRGELNPAGAKIPYEVVLDPDEVIRKLDLLHEADVVTLDVETTGLDVDNPKFKVLSIAFAGIVDGKIGKAFAFPLDHKKNTWHPRDLERVKKALRRLLRNPDLTFLGHNIKYDYQAIWKYFGYEIAGTLFDTMLMHWCLNELKRTHSLDRLEHEFTPFGGHKRAFEKYKKAAKGIWEDIEFIPLLEYNAKDSYVTAYLFQHFLPLLKKEKQVGVFTKILGPAIRAITRMERDGIHVLKTKVLVLKEQYEERLKLLEEVLDEIDYVQEARQRLFERACESYEEAMCRAVERLKAATVRLKAARTASTKDKAASSVVFHEERVRGIKKHIREDSTWNWASNHHLQLLFFDVMQLKGIVPTKDGSFSTDEEFLNHHRRHTVCKVMLEIRSIQKMLGTYINPLLVDMRDDSTKAVVKLDGLLHPNYLMHGTETGRMSCGSGESGKGDSRVSNYPLQTLPRDSKDRKLGIRGLFGSRFKNGVMGTFDYKQIELIIFGIMAQEENILNAARQGIDLHVNSAAMIWGKPHADVSKDERQDAKSAVSFGVPYGRSARAVADQFGKPLRWADKLIRDFFKGFPALKAYIRDVKDKAFAEGYVLTPFGRKRRLPQVYSDNRKDREHAFREAVNSPIQGGASDLTLTALTEVSGALYSEPSPRLMLAWKAGAISKELALGQKQMLSRVVGFVHDSVVVDIHPNEIEEVKGLVRWVMETRDEPWITCPTKIDCKLGPTLEE